MFLVYISVCCNSPSSFLFSFCFSLFVSLAFCFFFSFFQSWFLPPLFSLDLFSGLFWSFVAFLVFSSRSFFFVPSFFFSGLAKALKSTEKRHFRKMTQAFMCLAHRNRSDFCDLRLRCPSQTPEIARFPRQETAMMYCDLRVRWKVASDL